MNPTTRVEQGRDRRALKERLSQASSDATYGKLPAPMPEGWSVLVDLLLDAERGLDAAWESGTEIFRGRAESAEAEVERLREALTGIVGAKTGMDRAPGVANGLDFIAAQRSLFQRIEAARAALSPSPTDPGQEGS